jgi:redox-sensitive bicupin YhaK (pirin superfamily)
LTLVLAGRYRCTSQAGDSGAVSAGQWHRLGAGVGVDVVEENLDANATLRLLQLWVQPAHSNAVPVQGALVPMVGQSRIASPVATGGVSTAASAAWGAAATVRRESVVPGATFTVPTTRGAACWVEVIGGELAHRGPGDARVTHLRGGDGLGIHDEAAFALPSSFGADLLVLELPG